MTERASKRRTAGQGSIWRLADGWEGAVVLYDADGHRTRRYRRGQTRQEVRKKLDDLLRDWSDRSLPVKTLREFSLARRVRELEQRVAFLESYLGEQESRSDRRRLGVPAALRLRVFQRDQFTCRYCGEQPPRYALEVDHVVPVRAGGTTTEDNLVSACMPCNRRKRANPLDLTGMSLLSFPVETHGAD